jgi:hypothetical protein
MKMMIQAMNPEIVEILLNHWKTAWPLFDTFKNARHPNAHVNTTAAQGTPRLVVYLKTQGA